MEGGHIISLVGWLLELMDGFWIDGMDWIVEGMDVPD